MRALTYTREEVLAIAAHAAEVGANVDDATNEQIAKDVVDDFDDAKRSHRVRRDTKPSRPTATATGPDELVAELLGETPKLGGVPVLPAMPNQDVDVVALGTAAQEAFAKAPSPPMFVGGMPGGPLVSPFLRDDAIKKAWPAPTTTVSYTDVTMAEVLAAPPLPPIVRRFPGVAPDEVRSLLKDIGLADIDIEVDGHTFEIRMTDERGVNSGRMRWAVRCATCNEVVHVGSTSAAAQVRYHLGEVEMRRRGGP